MAQLSKPRRERPHLPSHLTGAEVGSSAHTAVAIVAVFVADRLQARVELIEAVQVYRVPPSGQADRCSFIVANVPVGLLEVFVRFETPTMSLDIKIGCTLVRLECRELVLSQSILDYGSVIHLENQDKDDSS